MSEPLLRLHDGFVHTSPELQGMVRELQSVLKRYRPELVVDGLFGAGTEEAVRALQGACGLRANGVVGPETWQALLEPAAPAGPDAFSTSYPLDHPVLLEDFEAAARYGAQIEAAAVESGLPPAVIVALGSRESRWGLALTPRGPSGTGDFCPRSFLRPPRRQAMPPDGGGFRRGLLQIDYDGHEFARSQAWHDAERNLCFGARLVVEARSWLRRRTLLRGPALLRGALAAYNCGLDNVLRAVRQGADVDFYTVGRDYARDILSRAGFFQAHGWD